MGIRLLSGLFFLLVVNSMADGQQYSASVSADLGDNPFSEGLYLRPSVLGTFSADRYYINTGFQWTFLNDRENKFSGWQLGIGAVYLVQDNPLNLSLYSIINPAANLARETNFVLIASYRRQHFHAGIGILAYRYWRG